MPRILFIGTVDGSDFCPAGHTGLINLLQTKCDLVVPQTIHSTAQQICAQMLGCDGVIAEISVPSTTLGYLLHRAEEDDVPVLCLFHPQGGYRPPGIILESRSSSFSYEQYGPPNELIHHVDDFLQYLSLLVVSQRRAAT